MARPTKKYRPYLTLENLQHLLARCEDEKLKRYLSVFIYEIEVGYRKENQTNTPRATWEEKLGVDEPSKGSKVTKEEIEAEEKRVAELFGRD